MQLCAHIYTNSRLHLSIACAGLYYPLWRRVVCLQQQRRWNYRLNVCWQQRPLWRRRRLLETLHNAKDREVAVSAQYRFGAPPWTSLLMGCLKPSSYQQCIELHMYVHNMRHTKTCANVQTRVYTHGSLSVHTTTSCRQDPSLCIRNSQQCTAACAISIDW